jgi:HEAT repeat protein
MTVIDLSDSFVVEKNSLNEEQLKNQNNGIELIATDPPYTDPLVLVDGVDHIQVIPEGESTYHIQYHGYVAGCIQVTDAGIREFGQNYLKGEQAIPSWYITEQDTSATEFPWWVPDSYDPRRTIDCVRCKTAVSILEVVTPGRASDEISVVDWFCSDCWEEVSEYWSPEWAHAGKSDIYRAKYLYETVGGNPERADIDELIELTHSAEEKARMHALTAMGRILSDRSDDIVPAIPVLVEKLDDDAILTRFGALSCLSLLAEDQPQSVRSVIDDVVSLLEPESDGGILEESIRFVSTVSKEYPEDVQHAAPALATLLDVDPPEKQNLFEAIVNIAKSEPEAVAPVTPDLCEYVEAEDAEYRTTAIAGIGYTAKENPEVAETTIPTMITLLDADQDKLRTNAAGLLADLSEEYPEQITYDIASIIELVNDPDEQAQHNATYVLAQIAARYPEEVEPAVNPLIQALESGLDDTRLNACRALGYVGAEEATTSLKRIRDEDESSDVQQVAGWALSRISN